MYDYDVAVIGGGPGGYVAAIKAAQAGKKTVLVEQKNLGGTCLNEGCIPTKVLVKTVNMLADVKKSADFGIEGVDSKAISVSMEKLQARKQAVVKQLTGGVGALLRGNQVKVINGKASLVDSHTVLADGKSFTARNLILASGSEPLMPGFITYEGDTNIITSTEALSLKEIPESMTIIGGGVIGVEFAYVYAGLGTKVTVVELMDHILPMVDVEISSLAEKKLKKLGVTFHTGAKVKTVSGSSVIFEKDGKEQSVSGQYTLMAVGRTAYTDGLNAREIGLEFDRNAIKTDEFLRTNIEDIYAIGDLNGKVMLAHTASREAEVAVANILGKGESMNYDRIPSCIYMEPEIASVGLTEQQARERYDEVKVGKFPLSANGKSLIEGDNSGMIKVILDGTYHEILGVHMFAVHATDMIAEIVAAMELEATAEEIISTIHPHPTVSEAITEAFMAACDKAVHAL